MKKLLLILLTFLFIPNVYAANNVVIESVTLDSKSDNTEIVNEATYQNLSIKFDIKFNEVNDFAKYKIVINNQTNEDYEISEVNPNSQYVTYEYSYDNNKNVIKKNSKTTMYINIKYNVEVPTASFEEGAFVETNNLVINLDKEIVNPNTNYNLLMILAFILFMFISITLYKKTLNKKYLNILIFSLILLPISIYALGKLQITVESKVEIAERTSTFISGEDFNARLISIIGENEVNKFMRSNTIDGANKIEDNIVSTSESMTPIYMWLNGENVYWYSDATKIFLNENSLKMFFSTGFNEMDLSDFDTSRVINMRSMFQGMTKIKELDLSNFDTTNVTTMNRMFAYDENLENINLSSFNTSNVTDMNTMFRNCGSLTQLDLRHFDTSKVEDMQYLFCHDVSLTNINVSTWNVEKVINMEFMFYNCPGLTTLDLSSFETNSVTNMSRMFDGCSNLTNLDVSNFNTENVETMLYMFSDMISIETLDISSFDTTNTTDIRYMFSKCTSLKTIYVSTKFVTTGDKQGAWMFNKDEALVGGNGTTYISSKAGMEYARIDTEETPGYFTLK